MFLDEVYFKRQVPEIRSKPVYLWQNQNQKQNQYITINTLITNALITDAQQHWASVYEVATSVFEVAMWCLTDLAIT